VNSKVTAISGAVIGLVQAVIILLNVFGWATITGDQSAAITAVITAAVTVVAHVLVNDQLDVALHTEAPVVSVSGAAVTPSFDDDSGTPTA
jgi:hypothetical protein